MTESAFLCVDIGTSSLKAALINRGGDICGYTRQYFAGRYGAPAKAPSYVSADAWLGAFEIAVRQLSCGRRTEIAGICISGNGPTIVAEDGAMLVWNVPAAGNAALPNTASLFIPRLALFRALYPEKWEENRLFFSGPEYVIYRLTGTAVTILPEQRYEKIYWTAPDLDVCGIEASRLPVFVPPGTRAGMLSSGWASLLDLSGRTPVFCGAPDFIAALVGTDTLYGGRACDRAGSSEGLNVCTFVPASCPEIRTLPSVVPGLHNASFLIPDSGRRFSEYKKRCAPSVPYEDLVRRLAAEGDGEGFVLMRRIAEEVKRGLSLLSGIMQGQGLPALSSVRTAGGQARSAAWMQYKSNTAGIPFEVTACPDAELVGDAVFAGIGAGDFCSVREGASALVRVEKVYEPGGLV